MEWNSFLRLSRVCGLLSALGSYEYTYSLAGSGHGGCSDGEHRCLHSA